MYSFLNQYESHYHQISIHEVLSHFPIKSLFQTSHFRFKIQNHDHHGYTMFSWVDAANIKVKAPLINNNIYIKILKLPPGIQSKSQLLQQLQYPFESNQDHQNKLQNLQVQQKHQRKFQSESPHPYSKQDIIQSSHEHAIKHLPHIPKNQHIQQNIKQSQNLSPNIKSFSHIIESQNKNNEEDLLGQNDKIEIQKLSEEKKKKKNLIQGMDDSCPSSQGDFEEDPEYEKREKYNVESKTVSLNQKEKEEIEKRAQQAVEKFREQQKRDQYEKEQLYKCKLLLDQKIKNWAYKNNEQVNIQVLLATLQDVLWEGCNWEPCSLTDLIDNMKVKEYYKKTIRVLHPDKIRNDDFKIKFSQQMITQYLKEAYSKFEKNVLLKSNKN